ncbi:MAG: 50S ribosome-binding GTPase, partial [Myxococcales bacterium]|nr:50S ribosome-binding GTPase [Myxococcales bacterium]
MSVASTEASLGAAREQMNIVIVGHVDHGKSTLVGRLLADTESIDPAKIAQVRELCARQGKHFEYAFLLDALEAERDQGITIDAARCFFRSAARDYIIIDAPGHIEFLKNMISGAARAEAAVLLIDAHEGVRENSRRHGYMLGLLGIRQIIVAVNKLDRVRYQREVFEAIRAEYAAFLSQIGITPSAWVPISALAGDNIISASANTPWYDGPSVLGAVDAFRKAPALVEQPLRMPVQDVYRFNRQGDTRRIIAGRIASGRFEVGDQVVFLPSGKRTRIASIEAFSSPTQTEAEAGQSIGLTMAEQIYVARGDVMAHPEHPPRVSNRVRASLFWLGRQPLRRGRTYKLKMATFSGLCEVERIVEVIDASALKQSGHPDRVERHEVAELILRLRRPLACDLAHELEETSRFVLVDGYDLAGGGIVRDVLEPESDEAVRWTSEVGAINRPLREAKHGHRAALLVVHDDLDQTGAQLAAALEESLWSSGREVFRLNLSASDLLKAGPGELQPRSITLGLIAGLLNAGQMVLATVPWSDDLTHDEVLSLPGLDAVPQCQVRFRRSTDADDAPPIHPEIGVGKVVQSETLPDGRSNVVLLHVGSARAVRELHVDTPYRVFATQP